jgi:type II secretory pathway pseudopilin PulG
MAIQPQYGMPNQDTSDSEAGYMLLAVVVMVALILIGLSVAAPVIAKSLQREKELESQRRANQYVRAIQLFYRKTHAYPPSIKALESTNNVRFLRQQYIDPLTGKADWKIIHQGEQQTKIHIFFGKELAEVVVGMGGGQGNPIAANGGTSGFGATTVSSSNALNAGFGGSTIGSSGSTGSSGVAGGGTTSAFGSTGSTGSTGSGTGMFGDSTGGVIVGVTTARSGQSITDPNQQTSYDTWEFWYDPRIEILRQSVNITGGGISSGAASSTGTTASSFGIGLNGASNAATGSTGSTGATGSTSFGNSPFH